MKTLHWYSCFYWGSECSVRWFPAAILPAGNDAIKRKQVCEWVHDMMMAFLSDALFCVFENETRKTSEMLLRSFLLGVSETYMWNMQVYCDVAACRTGKYRRFGNACCLFLQDWQYGVRQLDCWALKMEGARFYETSVPICQSTQRNNTAVRGWYLASMNPFCLFTNLCLLGWTVFLQCIIFFCLLINLLKLN
jgi:hypothetical protein